MMIELDRKTKARIKKLLESGRYATQDEIFEDAVRLVNLKEAEIGLLDAGLRYSAAAADAGIGDLDDTAAAVVTSFQR